MKKILSFIFCSLAVSLFASNLLENPSFEIQKEAQSNRPETWSALNEKNLPDTYSFEEKEVFNGKRAVKISNKTNKLALWMQSHLGAKLKKLPVGTEMELSAFVRSVDTDATARIYLESFKAKRLFITTSKVSPDEWTKLSVRFKIEDIDYGAPYVCLALVGKGTLVYDCAYLGPVGKNPWKLHASTDDFIANPSIEKNGRNGSPLNWSILNRSKNGKAYIDTAAVASGKRALSLQCDAKPNGMLAWNYRFPAGTFDNVKPETEMQLTLKANTHGKPGTVFRFYIEFTNKNKFIGTHIAANQTIYVGYQEKKLRFKMPKIAPTGANIYVQLLTPGKLTFDDVSLKFADKAPQTVTVTPGDYCRIASKMPMSNTFIAPAAPGKITIEYLLSQPAIKVELSEIDGKKIKEWNFKNLVVKKTGKFDFELPKLGKGAYELKFFSGKFVDYEWFRIRDKQTNGAYFMENGILNLDGKPFFPIGVITPENNLDIFRVYSQSGINTVKGAVSASEQMAKYTLNIFKHFNFACVEWNNWGLRKNTTIETLRKNYTEQAKYLKNYKGFIGFMSDEAPWHPWDLGSMRRHYKMMYKYLPDYVPWMNNAPRLTGAVEEPRQSFASVRAYSRASDVTGLDIYPVPEGTGHNNLPNKTISCVGDYTDLCFKLTWNTKPVWMILQAFGWSEGNGSGKLNSASPRPNEKQLRFMVWNAITHGATGIFWYGVGVNDVYSDWYRHLARVSLELKAISDMMIAAPYHKIKGLPPKVSGIEGKGFKVIVNENSDKSVTYQGKSIEPQGVLFITDKPLNIPLPPRFTRQKTVVKNDSGIQQKTVLLNANWTAHPEYLRGAEKKVYARHIINVENTANAFVRSSVDDSATLFINGKRIGEYSGHSYVTQFNIAKYLKKGENIITFEVVNATGPTGLVYEIEINGKKYPSGNNTMFSFDNKSNWKKAHSFGKPPIAPWKAPKMFIEK